MPRRNRKRTRKRTKPYIPKSEREPASRGKRKRTKEYEEWSQ